MIKPSQRRAREPLEVRLTVKMNFGEEPGDSVTVMNDRAVPMVDSVFQNRDRIIKSFVSLLLKTSLAQPKVVRELVPAVRLLKRGRR